MQYHYYFSLGKITSSLTAKFYTRVSGIMSIYKRYPKREDYDRVARAVVQKYPFLRNPISGHVSYNCQKSILKYI